jgi:hypothetical protein
MRVIVERRADALMETPTAAHDAWQQALTRSTGRRAPQLGVDKSQASTPW